jgi:hypothetical protein
MNYQEWLKLSAGEQDELTSKWGLIRGGIGNTLINEKELEKILNVGLVPPTVLIEKNEPIKKKVSKLGSKRLVKRSHRK